MAIFVLIHGSWHGGWCWERVTPLLEAAGHRAVAPDLPGMGQDKTPLSKVTLDLWTRFGVELLAREVEPVVLVGHSRGGLVISEIAERAPERVRNLVYLTAFAPRSGDTVMALAQSAPEPADLTIESLVISPDGVSCTVKPELTAPIFFNTTPEIWAKRAASLLTPEPMSVLTTPAKASAEKLGCVPKSYIECADDRAIRLSMQRRMQEHWTFESVMTLTGDHSPFYGKPEELTAALLKSA